MAKDDRLLNVARAQFIVPAAGVAWTAGLIMHAAHIGPLDPAVATAALGAVVCTTRTRRAVALPVLVTGGWLTAAARYGPLAGPHHLMTWIAAAAAVTGVVVAWRHPEVRAARGRRAERRAWLHQAGRYRMHGSHLVTHDQTFAGRTLVSDRRVFDTTGTGRLASQIAHGGNLAEHIAQDEGLPIDRVTVEMERPGRVAVTRRFVDPWRHPTPHPLLADDPVLDLPDPCTIRDPVPLGLDPDNAGPLLLPLFDDEVGAKTVMVVAKRREGKTTVLNNIKERVTAAADADLWGINLSKSLEDRYWEPACEFAACGPAAKKTAFQIIQAGCDLIDKRGATPRRTKIFRPTPEDRVKVLVIDEIDALVAAAPQWVRAKLGYIASKGGSEGVVLIIAGQRATTNWMAGGDVKANMDYLVLGRVRDYGEINHAAGTMVTRIPDMTTYGSGHKGVWAVVEFGGDCQTGRAFNLCELDDIEWFANQRRYDQVPAMAGGGAEPPPEKLPASNLPASNDESPTPPDNPLRQLGQAILRGDIAADDETRATFAAAEDIEQRREQAEQEALDDMDRDAGGMPDDLEAQFKIIDDRNKDTKRILGETANRPPGPDVPPEQMAESARQRWVQAAEQTVIPADARHKLLALLAGEGMSGRKITEAFPAVSRWQVSLWLNRLRYEKLAHPAGKGRGARWVLGPDDGDAT